MGQPGVRTARTGEIQAARVGCPLQGQPAAQCPVSSQGQRARSRAWGHGDISRPPQPGVSESEIDLSGEEGLIPETVASPGQGTNQGGRMLGSRGVEPAPLTCREKKEK